MLTRDENLTENIGLIVAGVLPLDQGFRMGGGNAFGIIYRGEGDNVGRAVDAAVNG